MIIPFIAHNKKSDMMDFYEISAEDYCRKQKQIEKNHKIIDAADLVKILMDLNFYPGIVQMAIESCPALDLFGDDYDLKDKNKTPTWGDDDPYILEEEGER